MRIVSLLALGALLAACGQDRTGTPAADTLPPSTAMPGAAPAADAATKQQTQDTLRDTSRRDTMPR